MADPRGTNGPIAAPAPRRLLAKKSRWPKVGFITQFPTVCCYFLVAHVWVLDSHVVISFHSRWTQPRVADILPFVCYGSVAIYCPTFTFHTVVFNSNSLSISQAQSVALAFLHVIHATTELYKIVPSAGHFKIQNKKNSGEAALPHLQIPPSGSEYSLPTPPLPRRSILPTRLDSRLRRSTSAPTVPRPQAPPFAPLARPSRSAHACL